METFMDGTNKQIEEHLKKYMLDDITKTYNERFEEIKQSPIEGDNPAEMLDCINKLKEELEELERWKIKNTLKAENFFNNSKDEKPKQEPKEKPKEEDDEDFEIIKDLPKKKPKKVKKVKTRKALLSTLKEFIPEDKPKKKLKKQNVVNFDE